MSTPQKCLPTRHYLQATPDNGRYARRSKHDGIVLRRVQIWMIGTRTLTLGHANTVPTGSDVGPAVMGVAAWSGVVRECRGHRMLGAQPSNVSAAPRPALRGWGLGLVLVVVSACPRGKRGFLARS
jgi:hypothetical protein